MGSDIPTIDTPRLRLRAHRPADLSECAAMWADPAVTRYIGGQAFSRSQTWLKMLSYAGLWSLLGYGYWALEVRTTRLFIGELGFADFKRPLEALNDRLEIGWVISTAAQRQGYATEALHAALRWSDAHLAGRGTSCLISPENTASLRLACGAGYLESARLTYNGGSVILFERR